MTSQIDEEQEDEMRSIAWEVIGGLSIAALLTDCVEALMEAYKADSDLYIQDKESIDNTTALTDEYSPPFISYINDLQDKKQFDNDPAIT